MEKCYREFELKMNEILQRALVTAANKESKYAPILKMQFYLGDWRAEIKEEKDGNKEITLKFRFGGIGKWTGRIFDEKQDFEQQMVDLLFYMIKRDVATFDDVLKNVSEEDARLKAKEERKMKKKAAMQSQEKTTN